MKIIQLIALAVFGLYIQAHGAEQLTLNHGQKWTANQATHDGMIAIKDLLSQESLQTNLAVRLQKEIQSITSQCTMEGEAHDQLHLVLIPIIENVNALQTVDTDEAKSHVVQKLKHLTQAYFDHFQP